MSERVHVLAAFGDIRGFGSYTQRITDDNTQIVPFLKAYDEIISKFQMRNNYFVKHLGDGFLCVALLTHRYEAATVKFLSALWRVSQQIDRMLRRMKYPRPDGFRIRVTAGHVYRTHRIDGEIDFRGYHVNLASKMLQIEKENHRFIIHESTKQLMRKAAITTARFQLTHLVEPRMKRYPDGIYKEDMRVLYSLVKK